MVGSWRLVTLEAGRSSASVGKQPFGVRKTPPPPRDDMAAELCCTMLLLLLVAQDLDCRSRVRGEGLSCCCAASAARGRFDWHAIGQQPTNNAADGVPDSAFAVLSGGTSMTSSQPRSFQHQ